MKCEITKIKLICFIYLFNIMSILTMLASALIPQIKGSSLCCKTACSVFEHLILLCDKGSLSPFSKALRTRRLLWIFEDWTNQGLIRK